MSNGLCQDYKSNRTDGASLALVQALAKTTTNSLTHGALSRQAVWELGGKATNVLKVRRVVANVNCHRI